MTTWEEFFKAEQLKLQFHRPKERKIRERIEPSDQPTAAPKRKLVVPPKGPKSPPGGGWRRTPSGWARGQGETYEWQPLNWADKGPGKAAPPKDKPKPHLELSAGDHKELLFLHLRGPMIANPRDEKYNTLVRGGYLETGKQDRFSTKRFYLKVTQRGKDAIQAKRAEIIARDVKEGKSKHEDVSWARIAVRDESIRSQDKPTKSKLERAIRALYRIEKKHGARPTTARGIREALGIPDDWRVPERGEKAARDIYTADGDHHIALRWTGSDYNGRLYYKQHYGGGLWQAQGKPKPAKEIVAQQIERERKWKERVDRAHKRRK